MDFVRFVNITLNLGGIISSLIGIVCVCKIAFVRPWQISQFDTEVAALAQIFESKSSGEARANRPKAAEQLPQPVEESLKVALAESAARPEPASTTMPSPVVPSPIPVAVPSAVSVQQTQSAHDPTPLVELPEKASPQARTQPLVQSEPERTATQDPSALAKPLMGVEWLDPGLATALVQGYLGSLGYSSIKVAMENERTTILGDKKGEPILVTWDGAGQKTARPGQKLHKIALRSYALVVHPSNKVKSLTMSQIADLLSGKGTRWSQLGGSSGEAVELWVGEGHAGNMMSFLKETVYQDGGAMNQSLAHFAPSAEVIRKVAENKGAIGILPLGLADPKANKILEVAAAPNCRRVLPTIFTVTSLDYPLAVPVYFPETADDPFSRDFLVFAQSTAGQAIINELGYLSHRELTEADRETYRESLTSLSNDVRILPAYKKIMKEGDRMDSSMNLFFNSNEMEITSDSKEDLLRFATWAKGNSNKSATVVLLGFADSVGDYLTNKELSRKRATVAADFLKNAGLSNPVKTIGFGEEMPVGNNELESGRYRNRRVEIWVVR